MLSYLSLTHSLSHSLIHILICPSSVPPFIYPFNQYWIYFLFISIYSFLHFISVVLLWEQMFPSIFWRNLALSVNLMERETIMYSMSCSVVWLQRKRMDTHSLKPKTTPFSTRAAHKRWLRKMMRRTSIDCVHQWMSSALMYVVACSCCKVLFCLKCHNRQS